MPDRVHVFILEDRGDRSAPIEEACTEVLGDQVLIEVARNSAEALDLLRKEHFDVAVCDLSVPKDALSMAPDVEHGRAVVRRMRDDYAGLPLIVLSDYASDPHLLRSIYRETTKADPYGLDGEYLMLDCHDRADLPECLHALKESLQRSQRVATFPVTGSVASELTLQELRVVQIFSLRSGGATAEVEPLAGGLSSAKTLRVRVLDDSGGQTAIVAAKLGDRARILQDAKAHEKTAAMFPVHLGVPLAGTVDAGASGVGGAFYRLADEHTRDLFDCMGTDPDEAAGVVQTLANSLRVVCEGSAAQDVSVVEIRRMVVGKTDARSAGDLEASLKDLDARTLSASYCLQHGDLHGANVLVDSDSRPLLIDCADARRAVGCWDPLTLELSTVFHPAGVANRASWPSVDQALEWWDLDAWATGCPFDGYVRRCREWSLAIATENEIDAVVAAYALRQLDFDDCPTDLALALVKQACNRLSRALSQEEEASP